MIWSRWFGAGVIMVGGFAAAMVALGVGWSGGRIFVVRSIAESVG